MKAFLAAASFVWPDWAEAEDLIVTQWWEQEGGGVQGLAPQICDAQLKRVNEWEYVKTEWEVSENIWR